MLIPPSTMRVQPGETADQVIHATDAGGDPLTFLKGSGPDYMAVATVDPGTGSATGQIHLAPPALTGIGVVTASVIVSDGALSDEEPFNIVSSDNPPSLLQPQEMRIEAGRTADQVLSATDADHDALTFSLALGPWFVAVSTTNAASGNVHLTPALADSGTHQVTVSVSDGIAVDYKTFQVFIPSKTTPMLDQPNDLTVQAGNSVGEQLRATDLDGQQLSFYKVEGPSYMQVSTYGGYPGGLGYGRVALAPQLNDSPTPAGGVFAITATVGVTDGNLSDTKSFTINITFPPDHPPVLEQPGDVTVVEGSYTNLFLNYSDPDGDAVELSIVSGPPFMTIWPSYPQAVHLEPNFSDAGAYMGTIQVTDLRGLSDQKSFHVIVTNTPAPPVLDQPANMVAFVGQTAEQEIHAHDPDGNPLNFSKEGGPEYMRVTTTEPGTGFGKGKIEVSPGEADVGADTAYIAVSDGVRSAWAWFAIGVYRVCQPALLSIGDLCLRPGYPLSVLIRAVDPEGDRLTFSQTGLPDYGTFTDNGNGSATLSLNPPRAQVPGSTLMTVTVSDWSLSDAEAFGVDVTAFCGGAVFDEPGTLNRAPVPNPGGPYAGLAGDAVAFDGTQSYDPEGQPLKFAWNFGDGAVAVGSSQSHVYAGGGTYTVELVVTDGLWAIRGSTTATIAEAFPARASDPGGQTNFRVDSGKPTLCVQIEPVNASYRNTDVDLSSVVMLSACTGSADRIQALAERTTAVGDRDTHGNDQTLVCFRKGDLLQLFTGITGSASVTAVIEGRLLSGGKFRAPLNLDVIGGKGRLAASVFPNPLNSEATISFVTLKPGPMKVSIFDVGGRLLRVVHQETASTAGFHELRLDGRGANAERLASGVYFYRVEAPDGVTAGRFVIMK